jgi:hypothetical protein
MEKIGFSRKIAALLVVTFLNTTTLPARQLNIPTLGFAKNVFIKINSFWGLYTLHIYNLKMCMPVCVCPSVEPD